VPKELPDDIEIVPDEPTEGVVGPSMDEFFGN
jgi:hypothetical protein